MAAPLNQETPLLVQKAAGKSRRFGARIFLLGVLLAWFGYIWAVSGVITSEEKYPNGKIKARGYTKRSHMFEYKRHGSWVTFHQNGQKESEGKYEMGQKVGRWTYWDDTGKLTTEEHFTHIAPPASK